MLLLMPTLRWCFGLWESGMIQGSYGNVSEFVCCNEGLLVTIINRWLPMRAMGIPSDIQQYFE